MVRVLRYPRLCAISCFAAIALGAVRDFLVSRSVTGWSDVVLVLTLVMLGICCVLMSCRFFLDERGVGVGFLLRVQRTPWEDLGTVGVLCCNSSRNYLYGLYARSPGFLNLLHCAPRCGSWGFVVPASRRLVSAVITFCPQEINFSPEERKRPKKHLRLYWHQAALYNLLLLPAAAMTLISAAMMLFRAATLPPVELVSLTLLSTLVVAAGLFLLYRAFIFIITCPRVSDEGICSGLGVYMAWEDVKFGYVHRMGKSSGMFLLSQPLEQAGTKGAPPIRCLSMPDSSTLLLSYLTYCPYAPKGDCF